MRTSPPRKLGKTSCVQLWDEEDGTDGRDKEDGCDEGDKEDGSDEGDTENGGDEGDTEDWVDDDTRIFFLAGFESSSPFLFFLFSTILLCFLNFFKNDWDLIFKKLFFFFFTEVDKKENQFLGFLDGIWTFLENTKKHTTRNGKGNDKKEEAICVVERGTNEAKRDLWKFCMCNSVYVMKRWLLSTHKTFVEKYVTDEK